MVVGPSVVPRVRVFEVGDAVGEEGKRELRELNVVEESDVDQVRDPGQAHLETDLRAARGGEADGVEGGEMREFTVLVLPP